MPAICIDQLTRRLKQKKTSAFGELYDLYSAALFGYILKHRLAPQENEAMLVTIFEKAWEQVDSFDPGKQGLLTWLFQLTKNEITVRCGRALNPFTNHYFSAPNGASKNPAKSPS